eukprot:g6717.t1
MTTQYPVESTEELSTRLTNFQLQPFDDLHDGLFKIDEPVWTPKRTNKYGVYLTNVGEIDTFGPFFRVCFTDVEVDRCLFCFDKVTSSLDNRCTRCNNPTLNNLIWLHDKNRNQLRIGSCVMVNREKIEFGIITGISLKKNDQKIKVTMHDSSHNTIIESSIHTVEILKSETRCLDKIDRSNQNIIPLFSFGRCGDCKSIYRLGMGNLTSLPGKKIDTFQFSYMKLMEKLDVARSQLSIFLSKKQKQGILATQENIRMLNSKMKELEPMLRSVTVQCPYCGWNISDRLGNAWASDNATEPKQFQKTHV